MMKILTVMIVLLVSITGCANISADNNVSVSGQINYEYQKSW
jgi:hypothetical protein